MKDGMLAFSDYPMFGRVMADEAICKRVVEAILGEEIGRIEVINAEQAIEPALSSKGIRMDVFLKASGKMYDIEMQAYGRKDLWRRLRYYQASMDVAYLRKGSNYEDLPESYIIFICTDDPLGLGIPVATFVKRCRQAPQLSVDDGTCWKILNAAYWEDAPFGELRDLLRYTAQGGLVSEASETALVREVDAAVQHANQDDLWRREAIQLLTLEQDMASQIAISRREGKAEGRAQGKAEMAALMRRLLDEGRIEEAQKAASDAIFCEELLEQAKAEKK